MLNLTTATKTVPNFPGTLQEFKNLALESVYIYIQMHILTYIHSPLESHRFRTAKESISSQHSLKN